MTAPPPNAAETPRVLTVAAGLVYVGGRVLVGQRHQRGPHPLKWEFPGGKVEPGEDVRSALVRELREELGVEASIGNILQVTSHRYPDGRSVEITFLHVLRITGTPANRAFAQLRWVALEELPSLDFLEGDRPFVAALHTRAIAPAPTVHHPRRERCTT